MRTFIKVSDALRREIIQRFRYSRSSTWAALNYLVQSEKASAVRRYALEHGGAIAEEDFIPNCRIEHAPEEIVQRFPGGICVRFSKYKDRVLLMDGDAILDRYGAITIQAWGNILYEAQKLSERRIAASASAEKK